MDALSRRSVFLGIAASLAAPAIVRAEFIMPVRAIIPPPPLVPLSPAVLHVYRMALQIMEADRDRDLIALYERTPARLSRRGLPG